MFADLEARLNRTALAKLANATAVIAGIEYPVIFEASYERGSVGSVGMGATQPQFSIAAEHAPSSGTVVTVRGQGWSQDWVVADRQPDGQAASALMTVILEAA